MCLIAWRLARPGCPYDWRVIHAAVPRAGRTILSGNRVENVGAEFGHLQFLDKGRKDDHGARRSCCESLAHYILMDDDGSEHAATTDVGRRSLVHGPRPRRAVPGVGAVGGG